ncbi:PD-(D/E)XK nuclease family protein [Flavihumibacter rivuli]|uniref:PD-(D/E)XK nuclease family protein n=1 Tax=Flavihumibacter rivuli TaxID=2838156 RepID=UPI001BDF00ED|nr:PD-(D/E)XK nuclease family protein [Flavihumibacter rivuli]ULQ55638.1 PD-(D/E)XK nuclease family protein [Flavihumibacter rivuli]
MFLQTVASQLYQQYGKDISRFAFVFPNKRPAVYFRHYLGNLIDKPIWSPELLTIHEFIGLSTNRLPADRLLQSFLLYDAFLAVLQEDGETDIPTYERFYSLGEILLNDYTELESNIISIPDLYSNMAELAAIEKGFDYLTAEQQEYLKRFWKNFSTEKLSRQKEKFLLLWRRLPRIFERFGALLEERQLVTMGTIYRNLATGKHDNAVFLDKFEKIVFIGFNALNRAELRLFTELKNDGKALFYFDADSHYIDDPLQEAGLFLRRNLGLFGNEAPVENNINRTDRTIRVIAAEGNAAQVRLLPQLLKEIPDLAKAPERIGILLADEQQLMPVLHSLPDGIPFINITMGYGIAQSPVFSLITTIIKVQESLEQQSGKRIYYQYLLQLLQHPYFYQVDQAAELVTEINKRSLVSIPVEKWEQVTEKRLKQILQLVQQPMDIFGLIRNVLEVQAREPVNGAIGALELQLLSSAYYQLNRLEDLLKQFKHPLSLEFIGETITNVMRTLSVPLEGEPLKGLQVMGLLESRGLDFDHIIVLNVNEGVLPKRAVAPTFIPDSIRRAYGLSVMEKQDAIFAYVFYRLLQRNSTMACLYNCTVDEAGPGEPSRFLAQLEYETRIPFIHQQLLVNVAPEAKPPISIIKDEKVMTCLNRYRKVALSPSAINNYIECPLRFYLKHVVGIDEPEGFQDEIDARVMGNILHKAIEHLYERLAAGKNGSREVTAADIDLLDQWADEAVDGAFGMELAGEFGYPVQFTGSYKVIREVIRYYVREVLYYDKRYAPFTIVQLEKKALGNFSFVSNGKAMEIKIGGIIDRIDKKQGIYRIIDYKTGKDKKDFKSVEGLFDPEERERNKAALQTIIYSHVLKAELPQGTPVVAGLYDVRNMKKDGEGFDWRFREQAGRGKMEPIDHQRMEELVKLTMEKLEEVVASIFDERIPFDQTTHIEKCQYCTYKTICGR